MTRPRLGVIVASTRQGRAGRAVADWLVERARVHGGFEVELVDLMELDLPMLDEPNHPRLADYKFDHTNRWSATVARMDAYVFVTPEYNYGSPPALVNALDYLSREWAYKPAGFVSYGGVSGGTRSVQMTKQIVTALRMMPVLEAVAVPFFTQHIKDGVFSPPEAQTHAAAAMLDELLKVSNALAVLRAKHAA